ncbi:hypothetical protein Zmor_027750 [Zophobas morio]|uniref:Uncharacterized protein n=1 Tax=Zophobas morio TaxID=2755281 RepID=A0AA38HNS6_9CUCU|nr:hypothetical protein Zmor_027750 [Zophobas morio]
MTPRSPPSKFHSSILRPWASPRSTHSGVRPAVRRRPHSPDLPSSRSRGTHTVRPSVGPSVRPIVARPPSTPGATVAPPRYDSRVRLMVAGRGRQE